MPNWFSSSIITSNVVVPEAIFAIIGTILF